MGEPLLSLPPLETHDLRHSQVENKRYIKMLFLQLITHDCYYSYLAQKYIYSC